MKTTVSSTVPLASWERRSLSSTARTVSSKVGTGPLPCGFEFCDGSSNAFLTSDLGAESTSYISVGNKDKDWCVTKWQQWHFGDAYSTCVPPPRPLPLEEASWGAESRQVKLNPGWYRFTSNETTGHYPVLHTGWAFARL